MFICSRTSERRIGNGLFTTMPSAPFSVCSHTMVTDCEKFGSARLGIAMSRWFVRLVESFMAPPVWACDAARSRNGGDSAALHPPTGELPFVGKPQQAVFARQLGREGIEGTGQLQDFDGRLVELRVAARGADDRLLQHAARIHGDFEHGACGLPIHL